jgi:SAM-dependent methyltransferase
MKRPEPLEKNDSLRERWEKRALDKGNSKTSVLFRGLPESLNEYIHNFHKYILVNHCLSLIKPGASILDLGCGYGRITKLIKEYDNDMEVTGLDFSSHYCTLYNKETGCVAVCADLNDTPFAINSFDCIIAVTSLMYIETVDRDRVMQNIAALLKPEGICFFLDPGLEFINLVSLISPSRRKQSTGGLGFTSKEYDNLAKTNGFLMSYRGGMTFFSLAIPFLLLIKNFNVLLRPVLNLTDRLDKAFHSLRILTLHRWMIIKKVADD